SAPSGEASPIHTSPARDFLAGLGALFGAGWVVQSAVQGGIAIGLFVGLLILWCVGAWVTNTLKLRADPAMYKARWFRFGWGAARVPAAVSVVMLVAFRIVLMKGRYSH